jgi:hypothetical protein
MRRQNYPAEEGRIITQPFRICSRGPERWAALRIRLTPRGGPIESQDLSSNSRCTSDVLL